MYDAHTHTHTERLRGGEETDLSVGRICVCKVCVAYDHFSPSVRTSMWLSCVK